MSQPLAYPLINGFRYDFSCIELRMKNKRRRGFTDINYTTSREHGDVEADGEEKIGRTAGRVRDEASVTMLKAEADDLFAELGDGFGKKSFDIIASYSDDSRTHTDALRGCCIKSVGNAHQAGGSGPLVVQIGLNVMQILIDGKRI